MSVVRLSSQAAGIPVEMQLKMKEGSSIGPRTRGRRAARSDAALEVAAIDTGGTRTLKKFSIVLR